MKGPVNSGSGGTGCSLTVKAPANVTVTAAKDGKTYTRTANAQGEAVFRGLKTGTWTVTISDGVNTPAKQTITVTADYSLTMSFFSATIQVTYPAGSTVTCTKGSTVLTADTTTGSYTFTVPEAGSWTVKAASGGDSDSKMVSISTNGQTVSVTLAYQLYATDFNWNAYGAWNTDWIVLYDDGELVPESEWPNTKNWKAELRTTGALKLWDTGKSGLIDVFMVSGGKRGQHGYANGDEYGLTPGGDGGGQKTLRSVKVMSGTDYDIVIGASEGNTSAFGQSVEPGGEGCGKGGQSISLMAPENGGDGGTEFGEEGALRYSGGGGTGRGNGYNDKGYGGERGGGKGSWAYNVYAEPGEANTGGGGGAGNAWKGGSNDGAEGGSGIVVIRNAR